MLSSSALQRIYNSHPGLSMEVKAQYIKVSYNEKKILELNDNYIGIKPDVYNMLERYMKYYIETTYTVNTVEEVDRTRGYMRINCCDVGLIIDIINCIIEKLR